MTPVWSVRRLSVSVDFKRSNEGSDRTAESDEDEQCSGDHLLGDVLRRREGREGLPKRDRVDLEEEDESDCMRRVTSQYAGCDVCEGLTERREGGLGGTHSGSLRGRKTSRGRSGSLQAGCACQRGHAEAQEKRRLGRTKEEEEGDGADDRVRHLANELREAKHDGRVHLGVRLSHEGGAVVNEEGLDLRDEDRREGDEVKEGEEPVRDRGASASFRQRRLPSTLSRRGSAPVLSILLRVAEL